MEKIIDEYDLTTSEETAAKVKEAGLVIESAWISHGTSLLLTSLNLVRKPDDKAECRNQLLQLEKVLKDGGLGANPFGKLLPLLAKEAAAAKKGQAVVRKA